MKSAILHEILWYMLFAICGFLDIITTLIFFIFSSFIKNIRHHSILMWVDLSLLTWQEMIPKFLLPLKSLQNQMENMLGLKNMAKLHTSWSWIPECNQSKIICKFKYYIPKTFGRVLEKQDSLIFDVLWFMSVKHDRETIYNNIKTKFEAYRLKLFTECEDLDEE